MKQAVTLATVAVKFLERTGLAPSTIKTYEITLLSLLAEYGSWSIEIISKQTLVEYLDTLSHLKYTSHHKHQAILQSLFNFAVEQGYIKSNPIRGLKQRPPQREKGEHKSDDTIKYLTPEQLNILYKVTEDDLRMSAIIHLLHRTGCRIGELLALNLSDLDIQNQKFQVLGKGNKQRWCFYSDDAAESLAQYFQYSRHQNINALFTARHPVTLKVSRISYYTLHDYWRKITSTYPELNGVRIHDLRHTYATDLDWVFFGKLGAITENDPIEQEKRLKYLDLVASAVILQNTVDMSLAIQTLMSQGELIPMRHLAAMSPYITRHIKRYGDYVVNLHNIPQPLEAAINLPPKIFET